MHVEMDLHYDWFHFSVSNQFSFFTINNISQDLSWSKLDMEMEPLFTRQLLSDGLSLALFIYFL